MIQLSILIVVTAFGAYGKNILDIHNEKAERVSDLAIKYFIPTAILLNGILYAFSEEEYTIETIIICIPCLLCLKFFRVKLRKEGRTTYKILKRINTMILLAMIGILILMNIILWYSKLPCG